jgi:phospholipid/cholesterol/gamma-HCH transport system ATP-binding protein
MPTTASQPGSAVIEMCGVTVGALKDPSKAVLEEVNWTVRTGDYWVVGGMHASGKSDLLAMTAGLTPPRSGSYRLFGLDMPIFEGELLKERLRLGLVFDGGHLLHNLTVRQNVALPLHYHRHLEWQESERRVEAVLRLTELAGRADLTPGQLGRSWQKRAGLARALMLEPEVLLLDNPLGGLDLRQAEWWMNLLRQLAAGHEILGGRQVTLVVSAEDLRPWRREASHFAVLRNQRLIEVGGAPQLESPTESLVKELLAEGTRHG